VFFRRLLEQRAHAIDAEALVLREQQRHDAGDLRRGERAAGCEIVVAVGHERDDVARRRAQDSVLATRRDRVLRLADRQHAR
jgi:hypothetical protein